MSVVSARIDDLDEKILKDAKVNISLLLRQAAHDRARRIRQEQALKRLTLGSVDVATRSEDLVREARDG